MYRRLLRSEDPPLEKPYEMEKIFKKVGSYAQNYGKRIRGRSAPKMNPEAILKPLISLTHGNNRCRI